MFLKMSNIAVLVTSQRSCCDVIDHSTNIVSSQP